MSCTTVLVGAKASHDGSTMIARTEDGHFDVKKMIVVNPEDQPNAYLMMEQAWQLGGPGFVGLLAQNAWEERTKIAEAISGADWLKLEARPIRTIAFYYYRDENSEPEKAIARLASLLATLRDENGKPKYRVVLISDEAPSEEDYPVSPLVTREQLPPCHESMAEKYASRAEKWQELIVRHGIDAIFYSYWLNPCLLWDLLSIKRSERHPAFVVHAHCPCVQLHEMNRPFVKEAHRVVSLADGVVTLSETDRLYWSLFNPVSVCIPNPCFVEESAARWTSLIEGLEKGARPNTPRLDEATEALLDEIDGVQVSGDSIQVSGDGVQVSGGRSQVSADGSRGSGSGPRVLEVGALRHPGHRVLPCWALYHMAAAEAARRGTLLSGARREIYLLQTALPSAPRPE